jgi:hypothetical protein
MTCIAFESRAEYDERAVKLERDLGAGRYDLVRVPANKR